MNQNWKLSKNVHKKNFKKIDKKSRKNVEKRVKNDKKCEILIIEKRAKSWRNMDKNEKIKTKPVKIAKYHQKIGWIYEKKEENLFKNHKKLLNIKWKFA